MNDESWPQDPSPYRHDTSSRDIVPYSSSAASLPQYSYREDQVEVFSSLPSSPPEYVRGRPEYIEQDEQEEYEDSIEYAHGYSHDAYDRDDQPYIRDDEQPASQYYDIEPFSSQLPLSDIMCEPPSQQQYVPGPSSDASQDHQPQQYQNYHYEQGDEGYDNEPDDDDYEDEVAPSVKRKYDDVDVDDYDEHYDLRSHPVTTTYTPPLSHQHHKKQKTIPKTVTVQVPEPLTPSPPQEDAQWRTGKIPGHQGSHSKRARSNEGNDRKRAHDEVSSILPGVEAGELTVQSPTATAEKVLKKPFRPPAPKIVLPKAPPKQTLPSSPTPIPARSSARPQEQVTTKPSLSRSAPAGRDSARAADPDLPPASQGGQAFFDSMRANKSSPIKSKVTKPFKTPLLKLASGSSSQPSGRAGQKSESVATIIYKLEQEARTLRQAVRYHTDITEDERLVDLIEQWRAAGREVVEQMFDRVPRPDPSSSGLAIASSSTSWFFNSSNNDHLQLTDEQEKFLKHCPKNADGEPVDNEGNLLLPQPGDLTKTMEDACRTRPGESEDYIPAYREGTTIGTKMSVSSFALKCPSGGARS